MLNIDQFRWSVKKLIVALCAVLIAITAGTGIVGLRSVGTLSDSLRQVGSSALPSVEKLAAIQSLGLEYRGTSLLMGTPGLAQNYRSNQIAHLKDLRGQIVAVLDGYQTTVQPEEKGAYEHTRTATMTFLGAVDHFLELSLNGRAEEAGAFWSQKGGTVSKQFRKALEDEVKLSNQIANAAVDQGNQAVSRSRLLSGVLFGLAIGLGLVLGTLFTQTISNVLSKATRDLDVVSGQVTEASNQLAAGSNQLAQIASVQAGTLEESSSAADEVAAGGKRNVESCRSMTDLMLQNEQHMEEATRRIQHALETMAQITNSSMNIARIIRVVDDIAFQTNILALNAAIEAARAGSAGAGFAVVADQVRSLAARSAEAAKEIAESVQESVGNAQAGKTRLDDVAVAVQNSLDSTRTIVRHVEQVDREASSQSAGINSIAEALLRLREATQDTAAMAEENASAGTELQSQSEMMRQVVLSLKALV